MFLSCITEVSFGHKNASIITKAKVVTQGLKYFLKKRMGVLNIVSDKQLKKH